MFWKKHKGKPVFHLLTPALEAGDAVSNDLLGMQTALRATGYEAHVYAEHSGRDVGCEVRTLKQYEYYAGKRGNTLIYHHSTEWPRGELLYRRTANRRVLKYHNITPASFFETWSSGFAGMVTQGREQTARLLSAGAELYLGDSAYNVEELIAAGAQPSRCAAVFPFHHAEELTRTDAGMMELKRYLDGKRNIVFVGRFAPNKGQINLVRTVAYLQRHIQPDVRLIMVGKSQPELQGYFQEVQRTIQELGLGHSVNIIPSATAQQLRAIYLTAHAFLCLSEHEGFCVPLVEAMLHKIPIVALGRTAVPETVGQFSLLADDMDEALLAEMVACVLEEEHTRHWLTLRAYERYQQCFSYAAVQQRFLQVLQPFLTAD